jgi:hypothetical protein
MSSLIELLLPDPDKPITFDSFVGQYLAQIRELGAGEGEVLDRMRAEMLAQTDVETLQYILAANPGMSPEGALRKLLGPPSVEGALPPGQGPSGTA